MILLAESITSAIIHAPQELIHLTTWLFTLKDHEYRACSSAHIAGGSSVSPDGKLLSLNVEMVGGNLLVQHYQEEISERSHCRVYSLSDSFSPMGHTKLGITWELQAVRRSDKETELINHVMVWMTAEFDALLHDVGITDLESIKSRMTESLAGHNQEETPRFAQDIEQKAQGGIWLA
ncbi:hypothetical protein [Parachryseolinea silvisoli]|uniref:hypothetical protein n=1 Tax=Parachryseolinea silvisoli TaxID=2873601 RepID=UPI002265BBDE|nr:hypothetical protein [Parachryseolinea silvisoli]MCD9015760.1 hypothetical protein [Parachryseolinea silvisoli]